jgi:HAD superfamily hydrolase (TIGR01549 family)
VSIVTRTIDTVLFDLDDTLLDDSTAYKRAARRVADDLAADRDIDAERLVAAYVTQASGFWKKLSSEHLTLPIHDARTQLWSDALVASGLPVDVALAARCAESYTRYRADGFELFPGALDLVRALREHGCKLGIVSNGFAATHNEKVDRLGLRPYVDGLFLADEMGMVKPDPEIFRLVCRTLGSEPARTAMVGDRYDRDIVGAGTVGLFTVLIDIHAIPLPDGARPPDVIVDSIGEVLGVLPLGPPSQGASDGVQKRKGA